VELAAASSRLLDAVSRSPDRLTPHPAGAVHDRTMTVA